MNCDVISIPTESAPEDVWPEDLVVHCGQPATWLFYGGDELLGHLCDTHADGFRSRPQDARYWIKRLGDDEQNGRV